MLEALCALAGVIVGFGLGILFWRVTHQTTAAAAEAMSEETKNRAKVEADNIISQAKLNAKEELIKLRDEFEASTRETRSELQERENRTKEREAKLDSRMDELQERLDEQRERDRQLLDAEKKIQAKSQQYDEAVERVVCRYEEISEMSREEAKKELLDALDNELSGERGSMIRKSMERVRLQCERESQKILVQTMQRYAGECAYDRTTSTIPLPSDEMKGRIIGREGRNIRVFEAETGVNVLIDDTPSAVVVSCFDPIRREVARIALERLVEDGRIHPTRVEEVVAKVRAELQNEIIEAGEDALHQLQVTGVAPQVVEMLGRLRYRYSYTQNVLQHSIEVASFMGLIAAELGLDVTMAKRAGLLHDIGKAMDHEVEGSHAIIGMDFLKRHGEDPVVLNSVGSHHNDIPPETALATLVNACDTLSASRPGARSETTEIYLKRLEQLEKIGHSFEGADICYAVQAGREIRVIVRPDDVPENQAAKLARDIVMKIEEEMQYPGQIKVCVIRETRSVEYAK